MCSEKLLGKESKARMSLGISEREGHGWATPGLSLGVLPVMWGVMLLVQGCSWSPQDP